MAERVKVYEETKKGIPVSAWLLPLLLLLALLAFFLTHRHPADVAPMVSSTGTAPSFPDLGSVHFDTDKATLTPEARRLYSKLRWR